MKQSLKNIEQALFYLLIFFLPTQLGKHFWPDFSYVLGLRIDYLSPTIYMTDMLVFALFSLWLLRKIMEKQDNVLNTKYQKSKINIKEQEHFLYLICIFTLLFLILNISLSGRVLGGLYLFIKFLEMSFVGYYTAKFTASKSSFQKVIALLGVGVIAESVLAVFQFLKQGSVGGILYFLGERFFTASTPGIANASLNGELVLRPYGTLPHPNVLAGYLLIGMTLILYSQNYKSSKKVLSIKYKVLRKKLSVISYGYKLLLLSPLIAGTVALFLSMSRVAIVLWVLVIGYFFIRKVNLKAFTTGVFATIAVILLSPLGARFTQVALTDEAVTQRVTLISASLQMIKDSLLLGAGLGNFIPTLAQISGPLTVSTYLQPVHNIFLLVAAETGLIGLGIFIWFLLKSLQRIKKQESRFKELLLIVFSVILITGFFDHYWLTLQQGQLLFAFAIGLCWMNDEKLT